MRTLKYSLFACLFALPLSCNEARLDVDVDDDLIDGGDDHYRYDLKGLDFAKKRDRDAACAEVRAEATLEKKPVDIIFVIDNSTSTVLTDGDLVEIVRSGGAARQVAAAR